MTQSSGTIDFFCLGAMKCGTSALTVFLGEHPQLVVPQHTTGAFGLPHDRGTSWLLANTFAGAAPDARLGIVNPRFMTGLDDTTTVERIAEQIHDEAPDARLLVILRDPIARAISNFRMSHRRAGVTASFDELALSSLQKNQNAGVIRHGYYGRVLAPYVERFPLDRFLIVTSEDLGLRGRETLARVFAHLGVDPEFVPPSIDQRVHPSGTENLLPPDSVRTLVAYLDKHWFAHLEGAEKLERSTAFRFWFSRFNVIPDDDLPEIGDEVRNGLIDVYLADAELLESLTGWLAPWVRRDDHGRLMWVRR